MVLAMETNTGIEYYESLPFSELEEKIKTLNAIADKRAKAVKVKKK